MILVYLDSNRIRLHTKKLEINKIMLKNKTYLRLNELK